MSTTAVHPTWPGGAPVLIGDPVRIRETVTPDDLDNRTEIVWDSTYTVVAVTSWDTVEPQVRIHLNVPEVGTFGPDLRDHLEERSIERA